MDFLSGLNPAQKEAVETIDGPLLLLAGAGSGKTRVLTHRIAYMIERGIDPFNIIAITFTNKAAREMKERTERLAKNGGRVLVATFHSACARFLRHDIHRIGYDNSFTICDADDSGRLLKNVMKALNISEKQFAVRGVQSEISSAKNELIGPKSYEKMADDFRKQTIAKIYLAYQKKLFENNALDFDDIIFKTVELFATVPEVLQKYQSRFAYVMVDEYQDTNSAQYRLIRLLAGSRGNLCVVGDDDQSIYGWRGANIGNILNFEKDFPGTRVIKLEQNYRSSKVILAAANAVISKNKVRKQKKLWTDNVEGEKITIVQGEKDSDEAEYIVRKMSEINRSGRQYSEIAVLYRTNAQSRVIEDALVRSGVPYRIFGGLRFYERREIKDVLAYLRVLVNPYDEISLKRIINVPKRGIGDSTIEQMDQYAALSELRFTDALAAASEVIQNAPKVRKISEFLSMLENYRQDALSAPVHEFISRLVNETGYAAELLAEKDGSGDDRLLNIEELINKAEDFASKSETPFLREFLEDVALVADIDNYVEGSDAVVLMTLHSSKGLEFPYVFISGFEEGVFPSYRSLTSGDRNQMEEERRLCYVGITRAKEKLFITMANQRRQNGQTVYNAPSSFLKDIPAELAASSHTTNTIKRSVRAMRDENEIDDELDEESDIDLGEELGLESESIPTEKEKEKEKTRAFVANKTPEGFGGTHYSKTAAPAAPAAPDFGVGDRVKQLKYGVGTVTEIVPAGADYEVTVEFPEIGRKKFMARLSRLQAVK